MQLSREFIESLKQANPIEDVARDYFEVVKANSLYKAHCTHGEDKNMSLTFYPNTGTFYCYGCGAGSRDVTGKADVIAFMQWIGNMTYPDAVKKLAERAHMQIPEGNSKEEEQRRAALRIIEVQTDNFHEILLRDSKFVTYLRNRGVGEAEIRQWKLGLKDGERIVYPIHNMAGEVCSYATRRDPFQEDESQIKYKNECNSLVFRKSNALYGLHSAVRIMRDKNFLVVVEGYNDVICLQKYGVPAVSPMTVSITEGQIELLKRYTQNILLFSDGDPAGDKGLPRNAKSLINAGLKVKVVFSAGEDPDDVANREQANIMKWIQSKSMFYGQYFVNEINAQYAASVTNAKMNAVAKINKLFSEYNFSPEERKIYDLQVEKLLREQP